MVILDLWWDLIPGNYGHPGYDVEIVSGINEGVGVDNVGAQAAWIEENPGTTFEKSPVMTFKQRTKES